MQIEMLFKYNNSNNINVQYKKKESLMKGFKNDKNMHQGDMNKTHGKNNFNKSQEPTKKEYGQQEKSTHSGNNNMNKNNMDKKNTNHKDNGSKYFSHSENKSSNMKNDTYKKNDCNNCNNCNKKGD